MFSPILIDRYSHRAHAMHAAKPSRAQAEAGNYRMGHICVQGLDITIETPKGRRRRPEWPQMAAHYGYFKGTLGRDGDHVDVFVGPNRESELVYVVDQSGPAGKQFDEHKVLLCFDSKEQAVSAYRASYKPGWFVGPVTTLTIDQFKAWLKHGDQTKRIEHQVSRYALDSDDLYLAPDVIVDRYEWRSEQHPRHDEGAPGGVGGQFAPTGQSQSGNRPGGSLSPRMLASAQEKWQSISGGPWQPVVPGNSGAAPKSSRVREVAALPDTIKEGHQLHLSNLSARDRFALMDWSRRLNEAMANVHGPNEEEEWQKISKPYIRTLLDEMNRLDRDGKGRGVRLSDYVNANGLLPESLASRLHGGARFFDPEHIRDKLKAAPEAKPPEAEQPAPSPWSDVERTVLDAFKRGDRGDRKQALDDPHMRAVIEKAMGLRPSDPNAPRVEVAPPPWIKSTVEKTAKPAKPEPAAPSVIPQSEDSADGLQTRQRNLIDNAIQERASVEPEELPELRQRVLDIWKTMNDEVKQHNEGLRQLMGNFGLTGSQHGALAAKLSKGSDYDKIPGFDEMVDWARQYVSPILRQVRGSADTGSDEEALAKTLIDGVKPELQPWHADVIDELGRQISAEMASADRNIGYEPDESVPFSVQSIVDEVARYCAHSENLVGNFG